jgi:adenylosuccinate synthase
MACTILVGGQFGDEGKGKVISYLAKKDKPDIIARGGVGPNAGHSVWYKGKKYGLRMIPSGFVQKDADLYIGAGVLVNPEVFLSEVELTKTEGRIFLDKRCGIIEKKHIDEDQKSENLSKKVGTTGTGCGPANADRAYRRIKLAKDIPELKPFLVDVPKIINKGLDKGKNVLIEGTQGTLLSLFYGYVYPYVTSKDTSASTIAADVGIGPKRVDEVILVFKAFPSRVGEGPFPTAMSKKESRQLGICERGTVTGRPRTIGYFDYDLARYTTMLNSPTQLAITCADYIDKSVEGVKKLSLLSEKVLKFIRKVEEELGKKVTLISTGKDVEDMIDLRYV